MTDQKKNKGAGQTGDNETPQTPAAGTTTSNSSWKDVVVVVIGILCVAGFGWFIFYLVSRVGVEEPAWTRLTYLLNGVEAVAFAAAGYLFGRDVSRKQAEAAEENADQANQQNQETQQENQELQQENTRITTNAEAMAAAIDAKTSRASRGTGKLGSGSTGLTADDWNEIQQLSKSLLKRK